MGVPESPRDPHGGSLGNALGASGPIHNIYIYMPYMYVRNASSAQNDLRIVCIGLLVSIACLSMPKAKAATPDCMRSLRSRMNYVFVVL